MPDLSHVMPNPVVIPILWGHDYVEFQTTTALIEQMISDLVTGPFMNGMVQYGVRRGSVAAPIIIDDSNPPKTLVYADTNNNLVDQITQKLIGWINAKQVPPPPSNNLNQMYLILPPPETTFETFNGSGDPIGNGVQALHNEGFTNPGPPPTYYWAIVKTNDCGPASAGFDFVNNFAQKVAHELAEQFVDRNGAFKEIGDPCENTSVTYRGWNVQKYWSDWDNGCINGDQPPPLPISFQTVDNYQNIFLLGTDGKLWMTQSPFGNTPPARVHVDSTVFTFQVLDNSQVVVLGTDGNLWLEQGPFGNVPPQRGRISGNVQAFQAIDTQNIVVLRNDGTLWREQGPFGGVPTPPQLLDRRVKQFHQEPNMKIVFVLDTDGNLWQEFDSALFPPQQVDSSVRSFRAVESTAFIWVLGTNGNLWLEFAPFGTVPPQRVLIDSNVLAFQPLNRNDVVVLRNDGTLWLEQGTSEPLTRTQIDGNVMEFAASDTENILVLGGNGKLWWEKAPFGTVPPARTLIDNTVA